MKKKKKMIHLEPYHYADRAAVLRGPVREGRRSIERYFERHFARRVIVTPNGRTAISAILASLRLDKGDDIYITTTFEKPNVSSCVTSTIFNFCRPSRVLTEKTKAIFLIHEFGVPHPALSRVAATAKERGIPLIEDCAHTIDSFHGGRMVGTSGDYAICSFSKIFPVRCGGLLVGEKISYRPVQAHKGMIAEACRTVPGYMHSIREDSEKKRAHARYLASELKKMGIDPLYNINESISPSLFYPVVTDEAEEIVSVSAGAGIESALWHGSNIAVIPAHQFLTKKELARICRLVGRVQNMKGDK